MARCTLLVLALLFLAADAPAAPAGRAACPASLAGELARTGGARQLVTVLAPAQASTSASVTLWQRVGGCWRRSAGPWSGRLGAAGVSLHHREGDGTTPEGAYGIGPVMYGVAANPGVRYPYHRLVCGDWWDEDPASSGYNTFVHLPCGAAPRFGGDSEALWRSPQAYAHFALIDYNTDPIVPGAGSAIFIHVSTGSPTAGCVALAAGELDRLLRWLRPSLAPRIVIGTPATLAAF